MNNTMHILAEQEALSLVEKNKRKDQSIKQNVVKKFLTLAFT